MRKLLFLLVLSVLALHLNAQVITETQARQRINAATAKMKSMQCNFVQTKYVSILNDKLVSKGRMYCSGTNKLRWEYTSPYAYTFLLNGATVQMKNDRSTRQVNVGQNKMFGEITRIMMNSVTGKCLSNSKDFKVKLQCVQGYWTALLTPHRKNLKQLFSTVTLHFDKSWLVSKVILTEKDGNRTIISLRDVKLNQPINAKLFSLH